MPVYKLATQPWFPDPSESEPDGLLAIGGDLNVERLVVAYERGIFPWYNPDQPILWWSPPKRMIMFPGEFKIGKSLKRSINSGEFECRVDSDFAGVIQGCAKVNRKEQDGTWITDEIIEAYSQLHQLGIAHSFETYAEGKLVGGLYGVSLGRAFFGESMFSLQSEASKFAFYQLHEWVSSREFHFIDCQLHTDHLARMGAREIPREQFMVMLNEALAYPDEVGKWNR